jgi:anti-sigma B factor antagonist
MVHKPALTISSSTAGDTRTLVLLGEIDLASSHLLVDALDAAMADGVRQLVLDFAGVTFVDSTGLGAMVAATKRLRAVDGDLVLRRFRGIPASALATTGLDRFFTVES